MERVKVILTSLVTWLVAAGAVGAILTDELTGVIGADHPVVNLIARVVVIAGTAVSIIRRVTPVLPQEVGVLPQNVDRRPAT